MKVRRFLFATAETFCGTSLYNPMTDFLQMRATFSCRKRVF